LFNYTRWTFLYGILSGFEKPDKIFSDSYSLENIHSAKIFKTVSLY